MLIASLTTFLTYFSDVAHLKSFTLAAKKNFISQSAISQGIKKLEEHCGFSLFIHDRNHFQLTAQGKALLEKIQPLLQQIDTLDHCLTDLREEKQIRLHFGCMHSIALAMLPQINTSFKKEYPLAEIDFQLGHGGIILEQVRKGEVDFGIVLDNDDLSSFHTLPLYEGTFEVFSSSHTTSEKYLLSEPSFETNIFKRQYKELYGNYLEVEMKVQSWEVIASLVEAGVGRGYFPDYLQIKHPHIERIDLGLPPNPYKIVAIFRQAAFVSKPAEDFLKHFVGALQLS